MVDTTVHLGADHIAEIMAILQQMGPLQERLLEIVRKLDSEEDQSAAVSPCTTCSRKDACRNPCDELLKYLPSDSQGQNRHEFLVQRPMDSFEAVPAANYFQTLAGYQIAAGIFTKKQWQVLVLYYQDGKTQAEIAAQLGKKRSAISDLLHRAKKRIQEHIKALRQEQITAQKYLNAE